MATPVTGEGGSSGPSGWRGRGTCGHVASVWWLASWRRVSEGQPPDLAPPQLAFGSHPIFLPSPRWAWFPLLTRERELVSEGLPALRLDLGPAECWEMQPPERSHQRSSPLEQVRARPGPHVCKEPHLPRLPQPEQTQLPPRGPHPPGPLSRAAASLLVPQRPRGQRRDRDGQGWPNTACPPSPC